MTLLAYFDSFWIEMMTLLRASKIIKHRNHVMNAVIIINGCINSLCPATYTKLTKDVFCGITAREKTGCYFRYSCNSV